MSTVSFTPTDWTNATAVLKATQPKSDIVFVKAKDCPLSIVPVGPVLPFESVFDADLKKSREPREGEKARLQILIYGIDGNGACKVYAVGRQIFEGIAKVKTDLAEFDIANAGVTIHVSGSGLETRYSVSANKSLTDKAKKAEFVAIPKEMRTLEAVRDSLLGIAPAPTATGKPMTDADKKALGINK